MVLNSLGIVTLLKPVLGYEVCAEIAREGYRDNKSIYRIVVEERKLIDRRRWDEIFSFRNLIRPEFVR
jgi:aspartate ammonia-lyase